MTLIELHTLLDRLGVKLSARGDRLHYKAPAGSLKPEFKAALAAHCRGPITSDRRSIASRPRWRHHAAGVTNPM
jgi:hypothetical protein